MLKLVNIAIPQTYIPAIPYRKSYIPVLPFILMLSIRCRTVLLLSACSTDRRLRARRAPLEGDEGMDTLLLDDDLERRASMASLPSAMLPRNLPRVSSSGVGTRVEGSGSVAPSLAFHGDGGEASAAVPWLINTSSGNMQVRSGNATSVFGVTAPTTRSSALMALVGESLGGGERGPSVTQRRHVSRLFYVSVANPMSDGQELSPGHMDDRSEVHGGGHHGDDKLAELGIIGSYDELGGEAAVDRVHPWESAGLRQEHQLQACGAHRGEVAAAGGDCYGRTGNILRTACALLENQGSLTLSDAVDVPHMSSVLPTSSECPQPTEHLPQTAARPLATPVGNDLRHYLNSGNAINGGKNDPGSMGISSGNMLRTLLRQHVSITDSMDLDSVALASVQASTCNRRPGRFEISGSESSSFVFGDDQERFALLQMLRADEQAQPGHGQDSERQHYTAGAHAGVLSSTAVSGVDSSGSGIHRSAGTAAQGAGLASAVELAEVKPRFCNGDVFLSIDGLVGKHG